MARMIPPWILDFRDRAQPAALGALRSWTADRDSRGQWRSGRSESPPTYEAMASDVLPRWIGLRLRRASVVGVSDGEIIGLMLASEHPARVDRLWAPPRAASPRRSGL